MSPPYISAAGVPLIYISGACSQEGKIDARAGYGIDRGPEINIRKGGTAIGQKTELRAELSAIITVLREAKEQKIPKLFIRHNSSKLEEELEAWQNKSEYDIFQNEDLLREVGEHCRDLEGEFFLDRNEIYFQKSVIIARRVAGIHSSSAEPLNNEHYLNGCRIIDIHGACDDGSRNSTAGFSVYWGDDDVRNENGSVPGDQTSFRGYFTALFHAITKAKSSNYDEVIIRSRSAEVHAFIVKYRMYPKHRDIIDRIEKLRRSMNIMHILSRRANSPPGQTSAEELAKEISCAKKLNPNGRFDVTIIGMETSDDKIARYGIYWGHKDKRNDCGWIGGRHEKFCVEMAALKQAIEKGLREEDNELTVHTNSELLKLYAEELGVEWRRRNWPRTDGTHNCVENCHSLTDLLQNIKIKVVVGEDGFIDDARKLAMSVKGCQTVRTHGSLQTGNNEPVIKYGVFWTSDESKNEIGFIEGEQLVTRAKQMAVIRAMRIGLHNNIPKLLIQSDFIQHEDEDEDETLNLMIDTLKSRFQLVVFERNESSEFDELLKAM